MKNVVYTLLFAGMIGSSMFVYTEAKIMPTSDMMEHSRWPLIVWMCSVVGMVIWMILNREDSKRRSTATLCIVISLLLAFMATPTVFK